MNTFIVDKNISLSAKMLDARRLFSSIYEGIHGLASLLNVSEDLVTPKKNKANHPCAKQYKEHEGFWLEVLNTYFKEWSERCARPTTIIEETTNYKNLLLLSNKLKNTNKSIPPFINDKFISIHRSTLYKKDENYYKTFSWSIDFKAEMLYYDKEFKDFRRPR